MLGPGEGDKNVVTIAVTLGIDHKIGDSELLQRDIIIPLCCSMF